MVDWGNPTGASLYTDVLTHLKARDVSAISMTEGSSDTNVPSGARRYNTSSNKFQSWDSGGSTWNNLGFHAPIDSHIADTSIHFPPPVGSGALWFKSTPPTGYLLCDGAAISRATYAALFAVIGTIYGVGDGSTTFNLPNLKHRMPVGLDSAEAGCDTLGETGGAFAHTHSTPNHQHTIPTHTHDMANHYHGQPTHTHTQNTHAHGVPAHYHNVANGAGHGANIAISSGGAHSHVIRGKEGNPQGDGRNTGTSSTFFAK